MYATCSLNPRVISLSLYMNRTIYLLCLCGLLTLVSCSTEGSADWETLREQANKCYNEQQPREALALYEQALSKADAEGRLTLRQDIIDCCQALGDRTKARKLLKEQLEEAHAAGNREMEAEAMATLGMQIYDDGDKATAYDYLTQAVRLMEQSTAQDAPYLLAYYHYILMKRRALDSDYPQALADSKAVEANLAQSEEPAKGEQMLVRTLATRAFLYSETDSTAQADSIYAVWQQHQPIAAASERDICPYLMNRGRYQEVVSIQQRYVDWVRSKKGPWTAAERTSKQMMAEAEAAMGHGDEAYRLLSESYEINDTLQARQAEERAQELAAAYQSRLKTEQISRLRLWVITLGGLLAVVAIATLVRWIRIVLKRKNQALIRVAKSIATDTPPSVPADANRFATFDAAVERGQLYTQPDLSREMLADLMGVDRTTFSRIIREQSGCQNMNDYLNQKRLRLAAWLLREQPNYTIQAIMEDSGFQSKSNFIRLFRDAYGMTPSAYRSGGA